jgi:hypothetical protein
MRDIDYEERWAVDAMRLLGAIGGDELPGEEDLAVAVSVIRGHLIFENALALLEEHYSRQQRRWSG